MSARDIVVSRRSTDAYFSAYDFRLVSSLLHAFIFLDLSVKDISFYNFLDPPIIPIDPLSIHFSDYNRSNVTMSYDFLTSLITGFYTITGGFLVSIT